MASSYHYSPKCKYPGCIRPCYREAYGRVHDFCGRTHAEEYKKLYGSYYGGGLFSTGHSLKGKAKSPTPGPLKATYNPPPFSHAHQASRSTSQVIKFYNRDEPYYEFTNFYPCHVHIDGQDWPTTEHYFQAQKFVGTPYVEYIRGFRQPREAFQLSRDPKVSRWRRSDWESVKDDIMLKALRAKFSDRNPRLLSLLLSTGDKKLIEHTSNDSYWGDGGNGTGSNKLGKLLMQVRRELRTKRGASPTPGLRWSQDDSALCHTQAAGTSPSQATLPLRRSNSLSNIHKSGNTEMVTGRYSSPKPLHASPSPRGSMTPQSRIRHTSHHSSSKPSSFALKNFSQPFKKALTTVEKTVENIGGSVANSVLGGNSSHDTGPRSHTGPHGTTQRSYSTTHKSHGATQRPHGPSQGSHGATQRPHDPSQGSHSTTQRSPGHHPPGRGNRSSVPYNIITNV